jgi:hypothetical protein
LPERHSSPPDSAERKTAPLAELGGVSEPDVQPQPDTSFSRLDIGVLITLATLAIAAVVGVITVFDAGNRYSAIANGVGITFLVFLGGATISCGLACLARHRLEVISLVGLAAVGLFIDLTVLAVWLDIESESYEKLTGIAGVWTLFALLILGLTLAAEPRDALARWLYLGSIGASLLGGVLASVLVLDAGGDGFDTSTVLDLGSFGNESVLRPLAAALVIDAALWFGALAASRVERAPET